MFLSEQKRNLLSAAASANTSTTTDLKHFVHLKLIFSLVLFVVWIENFTPNRQLRIIRNAKHRIHSTTVYTSILFLLAKIISKAKNLIYFHTVYTRVFSFGAYRCLDSAIYFSTAILLGERKIAPQLGLGLGLGTIFWEAISRGTIFQGQFSWYQSKVCFRFVGNYII